ncbi:Integral membrane protein [Colletotrichum scovillei]|nr:Integral membrane protein [Colletotrichum scovillei]
MTWANSDLSVLVHATTWVMLFLSTVFLALRVYSRLRNTGIGLQADDWVLVAGWFFLLLASANVSWLMAVFLIRGNLLKITIARTHHNLQSVALGLTKTSFGITLFRLMPGGWEAKLIWGVIITMNLQFAIHIIAIWQAICGAPDLGHIGGDRCWRLDQSVAFTVFSALYSAICDIVLALLPWKMIFNLQMKQSERISVAVALSMGILAGVTGVMKAVQGYMLINVRSPDYLYNQAVYWIWSMAEPNVTIISASIPVLRGFVRQVRKRTESSPGAGAYIKTGDTSGRFYNRSTVTATRAEPRDQDASSDSSILVSGQQGSNASERGGITWTTEVSVEYAPRPQTGHHNGSMKKDISKSVGEFEMEPIDRRKDSI